MVSRRKKQMILTFLRDKDKKNWFQIIIELTVLWYSKNEFPSYYIVNLLYRKNVTNFKDYLSSSENVKLLNWSYSKAQDQIIQVENKLLFENYLIKNNIPTTKIFAHNTKSTFTYNGNHFKIETKENLFIFLENIFIEQGVDQIFCKPIAGNMGENVFIISKSTYENMTEDLITLVLSEAFIFQELIIQHDALKKINGASLNTLRVGTYKSNELEVLWGFLRVGRAGSIIDNAHEGGISIPFHKETGKLYDEGLQLIDNGGGVYYKHPDTGIVFDNFQIPYYNEVIDIVTKASSLFKFPFLGWDVAITPNGPVIIEANHDFHLKLSDRMERGLKRKPSIKKLLEKL
jgi:hypothetical protein